VRNPRSISRNFPFALLLPAILLIVICGCAPKVYLSSYSDLQFNRSEIKTVAIVLENARANNVLFAEIFTQAALERKKFFLARKDYILEREISTQDLRPGADAFLKIALAYCYSGSRTYHFPTSISAYAKLFETRTGRMVWKMNYAYSSPKVGPSAPMIEEVMKIVVRKLIDSVPLTYTAPPVATLEERRDALPELSAPSAKKVPGIEKDYSKEIAALRSEFADLKEKLASQERVPEIKVEKSDSGKQASNPIETLTPVKKAPFLIHVASVRVQRRHAAKEFVDRKTNDGTIHLATLVTLPSKGRWYRLLIGRFESLDATRSYIQKSKQSGAIRGYARPMKLPFSLLISSRQTLVPSQGKVEALRKKHFLAYLSPSAGKAETYDVLIGAFGSEEEATQRARILLKSGISAKTISP